MFKCKWFLQRGHRDHRGKALKKIGNVLSSVLKLINKMWPNSVAGGLHILLLTEIVLLARRASAK